MKKLVAALMAATFACVSVAAFAADAAKKEDMSGKMEKKKAKPAHKKVVKHPMAKKAKPAAKADEMKK